MQKESRQALKDIVKNFSELDYVRPDTIPDIELYMDQVTTFLETQLSDTKRTEDEKILTKTMINNYTKNHLLPPPDKKKYSKNHVLTLILIYYLKSFLSIKDIQTLLSPITDRYFENDDTYSFMDIYEDLVELVTDTQTKKLIKDVLYKFDKSKEAFSDAPEEDRDFLQNFAFICMLSFDVYVKKMMIEQMIDETFSAEDTSEDPKEEKEKKEKKAKKEASEN